MKDQEPQLPTMDWEALERHLAGLQFQEQEIRNQKSNYTSVSWFLSLPWAVGGEMAGEVVYD